MRLIMKKVWKVGLLLTTACCMLLGLSACGGTSDGLWLYKGNERMRTDGSERDRILKEIELDGVLCGEEDYTVLQTVYCTDGGVIFYELQKGDDSFLYLYDYVNKEGQQFGVSYKSMKIKTSDTYVYVTGTTDDREYFGKTDVLFQRDGTFVTYVEKNGFHPFGFSLDEDVLWGHYYNSLDFSLEVDWWRAGEWHTMSFPQFVHEDYYNFWERYIHYASPYAYFVGKTSAYALNFATGGLSYEPFVGEMRNTTFIEDECYILTSNNLLNNKPYDCRLYRWKNGHPVSCMEFEADEVVSLGSGVLTKDGIVVNLSFGIKPTDNWTYHHYSTADDKVYEGHVQKKVKYEIEKFKVGKYTFYRETTYRPGVAITDFYSKKGLTKRKLQTLTDNYNPHKLADFFDDIREV